MKLITSEATALRRERAPTDLTVEHMNPKGQAIKTLEMAVRRAQALALLCVVHMQLCGQDVEVARSTPPGAWGTIDVRSEKGKVLAGNPRTLLREAWGGSWSDHSEYRGWPVPFDMWWTQRLQKQIDAALENLPSTVRKLYL